MEKRGFTVWFTGLSGAGKTTLSNLVHHALQEYGITNVEVLDGEVVRKQLSKGLGFSKEDVDTHIRRIGWVAQLLAKHGVPNLVAAVSPYREARGEVRREVEHAAGKGSFVEVFVDCPAQVCASRGAPQFTGLDASYEPPHAPEVRVRTDRASAAEGAAMILEHLKKSGLVSF